MQNRGLDNTILKYGLVKEKDQGNF